MTPWDIDNDVGIDILKDNTISEYNDLRNGGGADFYGHFAKELPPESEIVYRMRRGADDLGYPERKTDDVPKFKNPYTSDNSDSAKNPSMGSGYPEPSSKTNSGSGYPGDYQSGSRYPTEAANPDSSKRPSYSGSGYPEPRPQSGSPSGYPGYGSGYPGEPRNQGQGYPSNSGTSGSNRGYQSGPGYPEETVRKTGASTVNAGYPGSSDSGNTGSSGGYPSYPSSGNSRNPNSGNPNSGNSYSGNPNSGYNPHSGQPNYPNSGNQYQNPYYNQGQNPYGNQYNNPNQAARYPQNNQGQGYAQGGYDNGPVTKKPSYVDQIQDYAKDLLKKVVLQKVIDSVSRG